MLAEMLLKFAWLAIISSIFSCMVLGFSNQMNIKIISSKRFGINECRGHMPLKMFAFSDAQTMTTSMDAISLIVNNQLAIQPLGFESSILLSEETGYSSLSLYFTLALYVISLPGLFSLVSRSVKVKPVQKTYDIPGPANPTSKPLRQTAAEVMAYFKAMNYEAVTSEETIQFRGVMGKSKSQAAFLTFCTFMGLGSMGLILSILFPDLGAKAYLVTLLSPYAGIYYWNNAQRVDEVKIKMETSDDEQTTSIIAQGGKEDVERFAKTLNLTPRGMVYVKGFFEGSGESSADVAPLVTSAVTQDSDLTL